MEHGNRLYYGDNLPVMREYLADESVDLVYLDPPFNSNASYNVLFRERTGEESPAQIKAFTDTWEWTQETEMVFEANIVGDPRIPSAVKEMIAALRQYIGRNKMMAYLVMMAPRLVELHRALKPTGSIYLHCDPTASHYLKLLMDAVFDARNFRNEIIWHYRKWSTGKYAFQRNHDVILFYSRTLTRSRAFNQLYMPRAASTIKRFGKSKIVSSYDEEGRRLPSQVEEQDSVGVRQDDVWEIGRVPPVKQLFPTQKPDPLLERIIRASSSEGDVVLDPFCGCGTTVVVAERLKRSWIGIDITHLAVAMMKNRLNAGFDLIQGEDYEVVGEPVNVGSARALWRQDPFQFQYWAVSLLEAQPQDRAKRGADRGIDGVLYFVDGPQRKLQKVVVQVKGGRVSSPHIRDLRGVVDREGAAMGLFITLEQPTRDMRSEAVEGGLFHSDVWDRNYPKIQIRTIGEMLAGSGFEMPPRPSAHRQAPREHRPYGEQTILMEERAKYSNDGP